jgi:hypothetical protein
VREKGTHTERKKQRELEKKKKRKKERERESKRERERERERESGIPDPVCGSVRCGVCSECEWSAWCVYVAFVSGMGCGGIERISTDALIAPGISSKTGLNSTVPKAPRGL